MYQVSDRDSDDSVRVSNTFYVFRNFNRCYSTPTRMDKLCISSCCLCHSKERRSYAWHYLELSLLLITSWIGSSFRALVTSPFFLIFDTSSIRQLPRTSASAWARVTSLHISSWMCLLGYRKYFGFIITLLFSVSNNGHVFGNAIFFFFWGGVSASLSALSLRIFSVWVRISSQANTMSLDSVTRLHTTNLMMYLPWKVAAMT